jgi:hypothetical protein
MMRLDLHWNCYFTEDLFKQSRIIINARFNATAPSYFCIFDFACVGVTSKITVLATDDLWRQWSQFNNSERVRRHNTIDSTTKHNTTKHINLTHSPWYA